MCYSYSIPSPFVKLLLIITVAKTLEFTTLVRYYFHFSSKIIFCLMLLIYYGIAHLVFILTFSSLFLFLTFSSCLSYFPAVSFILALGINAVKSWLSRMQGRVGSLSVSHFNEMSRVLLFAF